MSQVPTRQAGPFDPAAQNPNPFRQNSRGGNIFNAGKALKATNPFKTTVAPNPFTTHTNIVFPKEKLNAQNLPSRVLTIDLDETLIARVANKSEKSGLEKLGYTVHEMGLDANGKADECPYFMERPGATELLETLVQRGFVLLASSRNMPHHVKTIVDKLKFRPYFLEIYDRTDLSHPSNQDFKTYPQHSNRVSMWTRFTDWVSRNTVGKFAELGRYLKSKVDKHSPYFPNTPAGTVNKYPPRWASHVLIDDKAENSNHSKISKDWVHIQIPPFHSSDIKDPPRDLLKTKWWSSVEKAADILEASSWERLYETTYNSKPKTNNKVPVDPEVQAALDRLLQ